MFTNPQDFYYIVFTMFGSSGILAAAGQLIHWLVTRKKQEPEVSKIIAEGARTVVESLQVALEQSQKEKEGLQKELLEVQTKHKAEIDRLTDQLMSAQHLLEMAHDQINQLSTDLTSLRDEIATHAHVISPPE